MDHPLSSFPRGTIFHITQHYFESLSVPPEEQLWLPDVEPVGEDDIKLAARLINAFKAMSEYEQTHIAPKDRPNEGVWEMSKHEFHGDAYALLHSEDVRGFAAYMVRACREKLSHGLGMGEGVYTAVSSSPIAADHNAIIFKDRLALLAEALGVLPFENPEQGRYGVNMNLPLGEIVAAIERAVGYKIARRPVMGLFGLRHGENVIDGRTMDDVYCQTRLAALNGRNIAEIGAGLGGIAHYAANNGASTYSLFDLPIICLVQGYFLAKLQGPDAVHLFGEPTDRRRISVLPYWEFFNRKRQFDFVINRDSMAEIPRARVLDYLHEIKRRRIPFLSITQEVKAASGQIGITQISVPELAAQVGLRRSYRFIYWLRRGYIEEYYGSRT